MHWWPQQLNTNLTHLYYGLCLSPSFAGGDGGASGDTTSNSDLPRLDDECINNVIGNGEYELTTVSPSSFFGQLHKMHALDFVQILAS